MIHNRAYYEGINLALTFFLFLQKGQQLHSGGKPAAAFHVYFMTLKSKKKVSRKATQTSVGSKIKDGFLSSIRLWFISDVYKRQTEGRRWADREAHPFHPVHNDILQQVGAHLAGI